MEEGDERALSDDNVRLLILGLLPILAITAGAFAAKLGWGARRPTYCDKCAVLIGDRAIHDRWHRDLSES